MSTKKKLGQFFTTNYSYIMDGMNQPPSSTIVIEPFVGDRDILNFLYSTYKIECYDIEPRNASVIKRYTLANPPFVINPPIR